MKKLSFLLLAMAGLLYQGRTQILFCDDFQATSLDNYLSADIATGWTLYNDDNQPVLSPDMSYFDKAWKIVRDADGSMQAASLSYFQKPGKADRWMVSPEIDLASSENPMLVFRAKAADPSNRDGFEIRLSENGKEKDDFTIILESQRQAKSVWTYYYVDLKEYKGKKVHLAFIQNSDDCSVLYMDDILVYSSQDLLAHISDLKAPVTELTSQNKEESPEVSASLLNLGKENITSFNLCYRIEGGDIQKIGFSDQDIAPQDKVSIRFNAPLPIYGKNLVEIWIENINGTDANTPASQTFIHQVFEPNLPRQNTLIELFSSGTCSACVGWNRLLHEIALNNQANVFDNANRFTILKFPVEIPSAGDPTVTEQTLARSNYYNIYSAPSAIMNGRTFPLKNSETIESLIQDSLETCNQRVVNLGLRAYLKRNGNTFTVNTTIETYLPEAQPYRLFVCLIEDSIHHLSPMPNGETDFYHVVRQMMTGAQGQLLTPASMGDSLSYQFEYTFGEDSPQIFSSLENISAVVYLQNARNNTIIQSSYLKEGYVAPRPDVPETGNQPEEKLSEVKVSVYPNPVKDETHLKILANKGQDIGIRTYHISGKETGYCHYTIQAGENILTIPTTHLLPGIYLLKIETKDGCLVKKIIKH